MPQATAGSADLGAIIGRELPYLRRYARALTGSRASGDKFAIATLETIIADPAALHRGMDPKTALFHVFHRVWSTAGAPVGEPESARSAAVHKHMEHLTPLSREALLLHAIEGFPTSEVGQIIDCDDAEAQSLVDTARREMQSAVSGRVLVVEDEAIVALDLTWIVRELGHDVVGVARTRAEAVALAAKTSPDLVMADIQLADHSSGIDAVNDILTSMGERPVIFITAFPERLLTGEKIEPAFLISKPFDESQVRAAVSQAMFFASTESIVI